MWQLSVKTKETEKLIDELMKMGVPAYKPSANHVQLTDSGITIELHWWKGIISCSYNTSCHDKGNDLLTRVYLKVRSYTDQNQVYYALIMQAYAMLFTELDAQARVYKNILYMH